MFSEKDLISFGNFVMSDEFLYRSASMHGFGPGSIDQVMDSDIDLMYDHEFEFTLDDGGYNDDDLVRFAQYMRSNERAARIAEYVESDEADFKQEEYAVAFGIHLRQVSDADVQTFKAIYKIVNA
jgi:hypothetical protein